MRRGANHCGAIRKNKRRYGTIRSATHNDIAYRDGVTAYTKNTCVAEPGAIWHAMGDPVLLTTPDVPMYRTSGSICCKAANTCSVDA